MGERTKTRKPLTRQLLRTSGIYSSPHQQVHLEVLLQIIWVARQRHSGKLHVSRCRKYQFHVSCGLSFFVLCLFKVLFQCFPLSQDSLQMTNLPNFFVGKKRNSTILSHACFSTSSESYPVSLLCYLLRWTWSIVSSCIVCTAL